MCTVVTIYLHFSFLGDLDCFLTFVQVHIKSGRKFCIKMQMHYVNDCDIGRLFGLVYKQHSHYFHFPLMCSFAALTELLVVYLLNMSLIANILEFIFVLLAELQLSRTSLSAVRVAGIYVKYCKQYWLAGCTLTKF